MSISSIFDLSTRSMAVFQNAINVSAHNIANASNPNYSRQQVQLSTETPQLLAGIVMGRGVKLDQILRARDQLTDSQVRTNNQDMYNNDQKSQLLDQVQTLYSEPSDIGLSSLTTNFFNAWSELSVTPNSSSLRSAVVSAAQNLSQKVSSINSGLDSIKATIINDATDKVNQINSLLQQVQSLNNQITSSTAAGYTNNDLLDQRDKVLDSLSQLANINVTYDNNNSASVTIGGIFAADANSAVQFKLSQANGNLTLTTAKENTATKLTGGQLFADLDVYSNNIQKYQNKLDTVMSTLVDKVNQAHQQGYTNTNPPQTGINFFNGYSNGKLQINSDIIADPNKIAVSSDGTSGNGDVAVTIANIANAQVVDGMTISDSYNALISNIGSDKSAADNSYQADQLVSQQLTQRKESVSGVSTDEEMSNILQYQKSYEASAKIITIANSMLDTLLTLVS